MTKRPATSRVKPKPVQKESGSRQASLRFLPHHDRPSALGEIHSRPFPVISSNRVILHFAFTSEGGSQVSQAVLAEQCRSRGAAVPANGARYHEIDWGNGRLRWERHSEFSTFLWEGPLPKGFLDPVANTPFGGSFSQPGMLISASRIEIRPYNQANLKLLQHFDPESLCVTLLEDGVSLLATDFRQDGNGMTIILLLEKAMQPSRIGYYAKTAIDVETYRTLALLGLPLAQSLSARLTGFEAELARLTSHMRASESDSVRELLDSITNLASELEADAAASLFRFGATRAYGDIVTERLGVLGLAAPAGYKNIASFLELRLAPALRTCRSVEDRQANLSRKLSRAANLLRTRVEVDIEHQNRNLLESMNKRAMLQLRLQQTVEGLSVAAVSYYIAGLIYYIMQAAERHLPFGISSKAATGLFVPVIILGVWLTVRRIRRRHRAE
ncbi:MAG: DUF3422 family protein [Nitratireductor sp.]